jgi:hypothetical protein
MLNNLDYKIGSIITLKKDHPSGTTEWEVVRLGLDIKLKSTIIKDLYIIIERKKFHRKAKDVIKK